MADQSATTATTASSAEDMRWPSWRHKLTPIGAFRWPCYMGFRWQFRDWYFGPWLRINLGWWAIQIGGGTYE